MYIIECILKRLFPKKNKNKYNPLGISSDENENDCCHEFMPVDSTGEILACIKCGFIVKRYDDAK